MSDFETPQPPQLQKPEAPAQSEQFIDLAREEKLHALLGVDYDFAKDEGLLDMFVYEPETGDDGLMHLLAGNVLTSPEGNPLPEGFHHAPSAELLRQAGVGGQNTYTEDVDPDQVGAQKRRYYRRNPYEPYRTPVVIAGHPKMGLGQDGTGVKRADNTMYPVEYDPLTILQTVRQARDDRDTSQDILVERPEGFRVVNESSAPMLDGQHRLKIRLVMDEKGKIITALPNQKPDVMKLSPEAIRTHLGL